MFLELIVSLLLAANPTAGGPVLHIPPVDDCAADPGAPLHQAPHPQSAMLEQLELDLLTVPQYQWGFPGSASRRPTAAAAMCVSWISAVRSIIAYFERIDGRWRMTLSIPGD